MTSEEYTIYLSHGARGRKGEPGEWFVVKNAKTLSGLSPSMAEVVESLLDANRLVYEVTISPETGDPERWLDPPFYVPLVQGRAITDVDELGEHVGR